MFLRTIFKSCSVLFAINIYCTSLPNHDDSIAETMMRATIKALDAANYDEDTTSQPTYGFSNFLNNDFTESTPPAVTPDKHLASDKKSLASAQSTVIWIKTIATKCRKNLKTDAAKKTLDAIITACSMDNLSNIEIALNKFSQKMPKKYPEGQVDCSIHEWMITAHRKTLTTLKQYLDSGVMLGKDYEQSDALALREFVRNISVAYDDCHEEASYHDWICRVAAANYDLKINKQDIKACFEALGVVAKLAVQSSKSADDLDSCVSASAALEVVSDFQTALRITHVDRNKFGTAQVDSPRLRSFLTKAPQMFSFCAANSLDNVETELYNNSWAYWLQTGGQTIWVDPNGIISIRVNKTQKKITVGFLKANPYQNNGWLDQTFLADRSTEQLKLTAKYGSNYLVTIPASASNQIFTPFWHTALKNPDKEQLQLMAYAHIIK
jgi:hypothetical protein